MPLCQFGRGLRACRALAAASLLSACAGTIDTNPVNLPILAPVSLSAERDAGETAPPDGIVVGLAFSGGGTRAAAFAFGVLQGLEATAAPGGGNLLDRVRFVSGVSGGSVTAAYFGWKGREAFADFDKRFLYRNAEEDLKTDLSIVNLARGLAGGVNDQTGFPVWLKKNVFGEATFAEFYRPGKPAIWINASDIYAKTPFVFTSLTFGAICSDLSRYPIAEAVAASAAVPIVFAPVVVETYAEKCDFRIPKRLVDAAARRNALANVKAFVQALKNYRSPANVRYVKLLDGGLTDNWGLQGLTVSIASDDEPWGPLKREVALKASRVVFLVADAGRKGPAPWTETVQGPSGVDLIDAVTDTAIDSAVRSSFDLFRLEMSAWADRVRTWRCRSVDEAVRLGVRPGWNCRDFRVDVVKMSFADLGAERAALLGRIPTRFRLAPEDVTAAIAGGRDVAEMALTGLGLR